MLRSTSEIISGASASLAAATAEIAAGTLDQSEGLNEAFATLHERFDELVRSSHRRAVPPPGVGAANIWSGDAASNSKGPGDVAGGVAGDGTPSSKRAHAAPPPLFVEGHNHGACDTCRFCNANGDRSPLDGARSDGDGATA